MKVAAEFVTSAATADDFPRDGLPQIALVGRSNVGKSSLINALVRQRLARTSAAPGKTRLANLYRIARGGAPPFYLVDLPGYGYARGGAEAVRDLEEVTRAYFSGGPRGVSSSRGIGLQPEAGPRSDGGALKRDVPADSTGIAVLLLVDARHPGLANDVAAWRWMCGTFAARAIVASKIDKLARGERIRATRTLESVFQDTVLPLSAVTGEGLDELWRLIDRLQNNQPRKKPGTHPPPHPPTKTPSHRTRSRRSSCRR